VASSQETGSVHSRIQTPSREGRGVIAATRSFLRSLASPTPSSLSTCQDGILFFRQSLSRTSMSGSRVIVSLLIACVMFARAEAIGAQVPGEVRGRVTDARTRSGIAGARIEVIGQSILALADVSGAFVLRGLEPGTFDVRVRAVGHVPRDTAVTV